MSEKVFEIVSFKFKEGISFENQKLSIENLNNVVKMFDGFISRDYYYSEENHRWFDLILWDNIENAKKGSELAMSNQIAMKAFNLMNEKETIFSYYDRIGGIKL